MTEARRFLFVHLQKTAGTALLRRLRHALGPDRVYPRPHEQGTPAVVLGVDRLASIDPSVRVVTGHFPFAAAEDLGGPVSTFTVLRDPIERVLSFLRHQREVEDRFAAWPLEKIFEDPIATGPLVANHMVKMLGMTRAEMTDGAVTPIEVTAKHRDRAEDVLHHRIDVFGLQEHFEIFCDDLEVRFGWDLGPPVFMNRTTPMDSSPHLRTRIAEHNELDVALYETAVDLWSQRHPGVEVEGQGTATSSS